MDIMELSALRAAGCWLLLRLRLRVTVTVTHRTQETEEKR
jgi:hypothetical protein